MKNPSTVMVILLFEICKHVLKVCYDYTVKTCLTKLLNLYTLLLPFMCFCDVVVKSVAVYFPFKFIYSQYLCMKSDIHIIVVTDNGTVS